MERYDEILSGPQRPQYKMEGVCAVVGSLVLLACAAVTFSGSPAPTQLNALGSVSTQAAARVARPANLPASSFRAPEAALPEEMELEQASLETAQVIPEAEFVAIPSSSPSWVPYGVASAFFGVVAAVMAVFRPKATPRPQTQEVDVFDTLLPSTRRQALAGAVATTAVAVTPQPAAAGLFGGDKPGADWEQIEIDGITGQDLTFYDIEMLDDKHGFLIGSRQTLLETLDAGKTWTPRYLNTGDDLPYRYSSISFKENEGWLVGKPPILMHTTDAGKSWERIGLSPQLPGIPLVITALNNQGGAEMCTDQGGLYTTNNAAQNWKAAVEETVDATLNRTVSSGISGASYYTGTFGTIARNPDGDYIGVSSRGNFYMTYEPGQTFWYPRNRSGARRIQSMGWRRDGGIWEIGRGGQLSFGKGEGIAEDFDKLNINSRGYGLLDVQWRNDNEVWAVGGSGTLIKSNDGGKKWKRQKELDNIAANLYECKFFNDGKIGFVLGNAGVLLRYIGKA